MTTRKNRFKKKDVTRTLRAKGRFSLTLRAVGMVTVLLLVSGGFIFVYDLFTQSDQFQVREIEVNGNGRLSRQRVMDIAGIDSRTNILALNLSTTRKRLLADPWIADAAVSRNIPSGVVISIREEKTLAMLSMGEKQNFLLNTAGRVFKRPEGAEGATSPYVEGLNLVDLPVEDKPDTEAFRAVMTILDLAHRKNSPLSRAGVKRITMDRELGATVHTRLTGQAIKLGFGHYPEKCSALRYLTARMNKDSRLANCRVIDLQDINRIVITQSPSSESPLEKEEV